MNLQRLHSGKAGEGCLDRTSHDGSSEGFVAFEFAGGSINRFGCAEELRRPIRKDPFFNSGTSSVRGVVNAIFFSFISGSVCAPTLITATPPAIFASCVPVVFFAIIVGGGFFDLTADLLDAALDVRAFT